MRQVLIRKKLLTGGNEMIRADVLSERDGILRVRKEGASLRDPVIEVPKTDVIDAAKVFGTGHRAVQSLLPRMYPTSTQAMGNLVNRKGV